MPYSVITAQQACSTEIEDLELKKYLNKKGIVIESKRIGIDLKKFNPSNDAKIKY